MPDTLTQASLGTLAAAVRRRLKHVVGARLVPFSLTIQQAWVMLVLLEQGPSSLHPLAQQVWMDDPTASRVVKAMVGRGLLRTQPDPRHGRRILISLTPEALPMAQGVQQIVAGIRASLVQGLSPAQQELLREGLLSMIANLDEMSADSADPAAAAS
ncbi:MAG: winged helix DNA-binding protein [Geothrix sp.]|uniref:MarR family winged helix-turn-helix transcriptional regulator n=1 Tax=Geothrix sp. TaxID=1962974 RepID=UPI00182F4178|nr:MarR family transcriptional regulator [Geothrix sp.]NWJ42109.1 winged helix DNA-binding protein [Geothrix sp.]WIL19924.1 MAG: MarR family transcriptional regulator [Geothrix sp.]